MQFTVHENTSEKEIWELIVDSIGNKLKSDISAATSSFFKTADGIECHVRKANGSLIASCYSESDRMGNRRWTICLENQD